MKRWILFFLPLALAAAAPAQETEAAAELVKKLGDDDYAARESATKKLIELGEKAVPELEQALKSEDLEVRIRAARALRAIRGVKPEKSEQKQKKLEPQAATRRTQTYIRTGDLELRVTDGKVKLKRTVVENGEKVVKEYEASSLKELRQKHPELKDLLAGLSVGTVDLRGRRGRFGFDMDEFWKGWGREFDGDFWKKWQQDMRKESERLRKLSDRWAERLDRSPFWPQVGIGRRGLGTRLGVLASRPSRTLDAQLGLRGHGLVIDSVGRESLAAELGLQRYDVLIELNKHDIRTHADVATALENYKKGELLTAQVVRRAEPTQLSTKR